MSVWFTNDCYGLGLMFASVAWIEVVGSLLGDVMQNAVFAATVGWMTNFVFMVDAGFYLLAALLTTYVISCRFLHLVNFSKK